jgi:hypothetical protein
MTPRSLFLILIKIIGIFLLFEALRLLPQIITAFPLFQYADHNIWENLPYALYILSIAFVFYLIIRYCLFRPDWLVDKLALDKHFEEEKFDFHIHRSSILRIAVIVIGGMTIIDALPAFCREIFNYIRIERIEGMLYKKPSSYWFVFHGVKVLIGYILLTNSRWIVNVVERQRRKGKDSGSSIDSA